jgi:RimJ/RimL family protein N-acetyltransferase
MASSSFRIKELTSSDVELLPQGNETTSLLASFKKEFTACRSRPEWCFAAEKSGQTVGLLGYRAPAVHQNLEQTPQTMILFFLHCDSNYLEAHHFFDNISDGMTYEPRLWKLGYTSTRALTGLVAPLKMWGDIGTLGYIGVVPEHRGEGYSTALLQQGHADLQVEGIKRVIADTDALNVPMQRTFEKVGYQLQGRSWSYETRL